MFEINSKTPLSRNAGKVSLECPICNLSFERYACWAKRSTVNYCSRACAYEGHKVEVAFNCLQCQKPMILSPCELGLITTCSKLCSRLRKLAKHPAGSKRSSIEYRAAVKKIAKRSACSTCGARSGPWCVMDLKLTYVPGQLPTVDVTSARLVCKICEVAEASLHAKDSPNTLAYQQRRKQ